MDPQSSPISPSGPSPAEPSSSEAPAPERPLSGATQSEEQASVEESSEEESSSLESLSEDPAVKEARAAVAVFDAYVVDLNSRAAPGRKTPLGATAEERRLIRESIFEAYRSALKYIDPDDRKSFAMVGGSALIYHDNTQNATWLEIAAPKRIAIYFKYKAWQSKAVDFDVDWEHNNEAIRYKSSHGIEIAINLLVLGCWGLPEEIEGTTSFEDSQGVVATAQQVVALTQLMDEDDRKQHDKGQFKRHWFSGPFQIAMHM